jgi:uncharacterized membrane protein YfcA
VTVPISLGEYLVILLTAAVGATVQGSVGFGANLIAVPVVAVVVPEALPVVLIVWVLPLVIAMTVREHHGVDWSGVRWIALGRLPGTAVGTWVVAEVADDTLSVLCGAAVLVAVATSLVTTTVRVTPVTKALAGFTAGVMGTATSIGGPPMALLYQHHDGRTLRATLAAAFTIGTTTSLLGLAISGAIEAWQVRLALALLPGLAAGMLVSRAVAHHLDRRWLRPAVLSFAGVAALVAVIQGLG